MEIERKFLVNDLNGINLEEYEYKKWLRTIYI